MKCKGSGVVSLCIGHLVGPIVRPHCNRFAFVRATADRIVLISIKGEFCHAIVYYSGISTQGKADPAE